MDHPVQLYWKYTKRKADFLFKTGPRLSLKQCALTWKVGNVANRGKVPYAICTSLEDNADRLLGTCIEQLESCSIGKTTCNTFR